MKSKATILALALAGMAATATHAASPIYYNPSNSGNQSWGGMLGNDFLVNSGSVQLTALGAFTGATQGFASGTSISVGLYDVTELYDGNTGTNQIAQVIAPITFTGSAGTLVSSYAYLNVAPIMLTSGHVYSIQASGFNGTDPNFNTNIGGATQSFDTLGGALTQKLGRYANAATLGVAGIEGNWSFGGGSAMVAVVPEAETWAMMMAGLGLVGLQLRRKSKVTQQLAVN